MKILFSYCFFTEITPVSFQNFRIVLCFSIRQVKLCTNMQHVCLSLGKFWRCLCSHVFCHLKSLILEGVKTLLLFLTYQSPRKMCTLERWSLTNSYGIQLTFTKSKLCLHFSKETFFCIWQILVHMAVGLLWSSALSFVHGSHIDDSKSPGVHVSYWY